MENKVHTCPKCESGCTGLCCTTVQNLGVTIGKTKILENINLHIHCGELTAIIGPNGAGKSTLLKAILGEIKHTGTLKFLDEKGESGEPLIGYVPQHLDFDISTPTSVLDLFSASTSAVPAWLGSSKKNREKAAQSLSRLKAEHLIHRPLGALSGGELQRVLLALALEPVPELLLLDEPVSGIDHNGLELFYSEVSKLRQQYDLSIILISHDLDLVSKHADRVILLNKTILKNGSPDEVFNDDHTAALLGMSWTQKPSDSLCMAETEAK